MSLEVVVVVENVDEDEEQEKQKKEEEAQYEDKKDKEREEGRPNHRGPNLCAVGRSDGAPVERDACMCGASGRY